MLGRANMGLSSTQPPSANYAVHEDRDGDEKASVQKGDGEEEEGGGDEEFVLLDLKEVFHGAGLPHNIPYTLSGLETMNPILTLGNGGSLRLVGDYEETTGTCLVFTEHEEKLPLEGTVHPQNGSGQQEPQQTTRKRINSLCKLDKKLKFRMSDTSKNEAEKAN